MSVDDDSRIPDYSTPRLTALRGEAVHLSPECGREGAAQVGHPGVSGTKRPRVAGSAGTVVAAARPGHAVTRPTTALAWPRPPRPRVWSPFKARLF